MNESNKEELNNLHKGEIYGDLQIIDFAYKSDSNDIYYNAKCLKCGDIIQTRLNSLKKYGKSNKCSCYKKKKIQIGCIYGKLEVLEFDRNEGNGKIFYKCKCTECGKEMIIRSDIIKKGSYSKCDCNSNGIKVGEVYGNLRVLELYNNDHSKKYYRCKCLKCGKESAPDMVIRSDNIKKYGKTIKCDCKLERYNQIENLVGKKFGYLVVEEFAGKTNSNESLWKCFCTKCNKNHPITSRSTLLNGSGMCRDCAMEQVWSNNLIDLTGKRFGKVVILERDTDYESNKDYRVTYWKYQCDCGNICSAPYNSFTREHPLSCCPECYVNPNITHGMSGTPFYNVWSNMKSRCYNKNYINYCNYGERGIKVCEEWKNSFINFYNDMYTDYLKHVAVYGQRNTSLDRINNDGDYCKENCRWATSLQQVNNTRIVNRYEYNGENYTLTELMNAGLVNDTISREGLRHRIRRGKSIGQAIADPNMHLIKSPIKIVSDAEKQKYIKYINKKASVK